MKYDVEFEGFDDLEKALRKLPDRVQKRVSQSAVTGSIRKARKEIKASAPRGDGSSKAAQQYGQLYKNIKVGKARTRNRNQKSAFVSTGNAFWGYFLEFGTRYIPARPWFIPAFERTTNVMLEELRIRIGKGIDKEFDKLK